ncbi:MAG: hypothetical protein KDK39_18235, partial [Leptospiraceae bacterium]|nr:hypothetical protein [Leptospiraceae bacterium]
MKAHKPLFLQGIPTLFLSIFLLSACDAPPKVEQAKPVGVIHRLIGSAELILDGQETPARQGAIVLHRHRIRTGPNSTAVVQFGQNGTAVEVQANSDFSIHEFNQQLQSF